MPSSNGAKNVQLSDFEVLSFDCYGTLEDWEAGLAAVGAGASSLQIAVRISKRRPAVGRPQLNIARGNGISLSRRRSQQTHAPAASVTYMCR
jgi:hypothetical protein